MKFKLLPVFLSLLFATHMAWASPENDRVYRLESVGCLKTTDNVDGIFGDYMEDQYNQYFSHQTRFIQKKLKGLDEVLGTSPRKEAELFSQPEILKKISQKYRAESLIRTRVYKENDSYRFVMDWVYAPKGEVLATTEFRYIDNGKDQGLQGSDLPVAVHKGLDDLVHKLPFLGEVTGVESETITVNMGHGQGVKDHDILTVYTLQSLKRHPLLKTIEEWRWQKVARIQVDQVEESLSFGKVIELEPGQTLLRLQKVRDIETPPVVEAQKNAPEARKDLPRIGWVAGNVGIGNYSRDVGLANNTSGRTGGGFSETFAIDAQVWLNSRFIAEGSIAAALFKYNPKDLVSGASLPGSYSGSGDQFRLAMGYSLFPMKTLYDPMAWVHVGYKSTNYSLPTSNSDFTADSDFTSLFVGLGGSMQFNKDFGAQLGIDIGLIKGADSKNLGFGDASASSDLSFSVAGTYHLEDQLWLRLVVGLSSQSMDFVNGQSVTEKLFSVTPSIMYYF